MADQDPGTSEERGTGDDSGLSRRQNPVGRREADKERAWLWKLVVGCAAICVLCAIVCLAVSFTTLRNRVDIVHTKDVVHAIQDERTDVIQRNCEAQNARHDATVQRLDARIASLPPGERFRAQANRDFTVGLIDALQPRVLDCRALADRNVRAGDGG
jgi:hypothetical protein